MGLTTPEKVDEAGLAARDLTAQRRLPRDPYPLGHVDDPSAVTPIVARRARTRPADELTDHLPERPQGFVPDDVGLEGASEDELAAAVDKHTPSNLDVLKCSNECPSTTDGGRGSNPAVAPALVDKVPGWRASTSAPATPRIAVRTRPACTRTLRRPRARRCPRRWKNRQGTRLAGHRGRRAHSVWESHRGWLGWATEVEAW